MGGQYSSSPSLLWILLVLSKEFSCSPPLHFARHGNRQLGSETAQRRRLPMSLSAQDSKPEVRYHIL